MIDTLPTWLRNLLPAPSSVDGVERLRSCAGAALGILTTGLLSAWFLGAQGAAWLIAPMGASAVLLFAVPASPLAQPWSIVGGNLVAAVVGVTCARLISEPAFAAAAAIFFAIAVMFLLRCIHPPSGAVALTAVLGGAGVHAAGYSFVFVPVMLNSLLLLGVALAYNNATRRRYPHPQQWPAPSAAAPSAEQTPMARLGFSVQDLQAVLRSHNEVLDVSADVLEDLFHRTEMHAFRRRFSDARCADIMAREVTAVEFGTELEEAWLLMIGRGLHAMPVISRERLVIGIVTRSDFLRHVDLTNIKTLGAKLRSFLQRTPNTHSDKPEVVGQIMTSRVSTAPEDMPIVELVPLMSARGLQHVPVVDAGRRLVGMVAQADLVAALFETGLAGLVPRAAIPPERPRGRAAA